MVKRATILFGVTVVMLAGCGLDPLVWGNLTDDEFKQPPAAGTNTVSGIASALGTGATAQFYGPAGKLLEGRSASTAEGGTFSVEFPAAEAFENLVVTVATSSANLLGIVPQVPAKETVYDASINVSLGTDLPADDGTARAVPFMDDLGARSTAATLLLLAKQRYANPASTLATVSPSALVSALEEIETLIGGDDARLMPFVAMVDRITAAGATTGPAFRPFAKDADSYLDATALAATTDYDNDGSADSSSAAFDAALMVAIGALEFNVCYSQDAIRVVFMVDFNEGGVDRNCSTINRWKWTTDDADSSMFIVGSLHESTPNCDSGDPAPCLTNETFDTASQLLGNWEPNTVPMYDDGTNGDEVAGDNIWTLAVVLPWWTDAEAEANGRNKWVRAKYKYTWGTPGHLWTGTEEWPGNARILELRDVNGDHMIVRRDFYGDETTNKDVSNLLAPNKGGCGTVLFAAENEAAVAEGTRKETCANDTLENMVDFDKDCVLDGYPSPGTSSPVTVPCPE